MNWIWFVLFLSGVVVAAATGRIEAVTQGVLDGAKDGVVVSFGLISIMTFWLGMMKIAEDAGLVRALARFVRPLAHWLYPSVPVEHEAMGSLIANMSANILGLGNAATPLGLKAMRDLQALNADKTRASDAMCTLLAMNTASLTVIPATIIGLRMQYHAKAPADIVLSSIVATFLATLAAVILDRFFRRRDNKHHVSACKP